MLKKYLFVVLIALSAAIVGCDRNNTETTIDVVSVEVAPAEATLTGVGETLTLTATVLPEDATEGSVVWSSSDEAVATVNASGVVTAIDTGVVEITATAGGKTGKATVTVEILRMVEVLSVEVAPAEATLTEVGETLTLTATVLPEDATEGSVVWSSSDEAVATVNASGVVTAVAEGVAEITATAGRATGKATITVAIDTPEPEPNLKSGKVYAVGTDLDSSNRRFATLWMDDQTIRLSKNQGSYAKSVYVDESDNVYAVGWDVVGGAFLPALWVNGEEGQLLESGGYGEAYSVFVSDGDVYVAGCYDATGSGLALRAAFWKNGVRQDISTTDGYATSVYAQGTDVYVAYWRQNSLDEYQACLWHNDTETVLSMAESEAFAVTVHNGDVYVAGRKHVEDILWCAVLWKNGVEQLLSDEFSYARSIYVDGDDIYVCGLNGSGSYNSASKAMYWKNGEIHNLTDGTASADANAVFVRDGDVYVGGYDTPELNSYDMHYAKIWKNDVTTQISDSQSEVHGLYVKK